MQIVDREYMVMDTNALQLQGINSVARPVLMSMLRSILDPQKSKEAVVVFFGF